MAAKLYDTYYSASDVNVYLEYTVTGRRVHIDKAIGIGFSHSMSSAPIYTLGNVQPAFFSRGNSLVQGNLDLAFKSTAYLQAGIKYLLNQTGLENEQEKLLATASQRNLTKTEVNRLFELQTQSLSTMATISISQIFNLFNIIIEFNNTNATTDGVSSRLVIEGVKFTGQAMGVNSSEESALVDRYTFLAKNKT